MIKNTTLFYILCIFLGVLLFTGGIYFGVANFLPNVFAGWSQFFFELVVGILVINRFLKRQEELKWKKVKNIYYKILTEHLIKLLIKISLKFNYLDITKSLMFKKKTGKDISNICENLTKELNYLDSLED